MNTQQNTNNKQTGEELQQEVWKETEADFEKRRKRGIWSLVYKFPYFLGWIVGLGGIAILFSVIAIQEKTIFFILLSIAIWIIACVFPYMLASEYFKRYNVSRKLKDLKVSLKEKLQGRTTIQRRLTARKTKLLSKNNFLSWMCLLPKDIPDQKWRYYVVSMIKQEEERVKKLQRSYDVLDEEIIRLEAELQFYNQVQEKTFWQYVKSKKWIKKEK